MLENSQTLFDWQDGARGALADICRMVSAIPVMRGMLEIHPELADVKITLTETEDTAAGYGRYIYADKCVELNYRIIQAEAAEAGMTQDDVDLICAYTLLHELRHAHQAKFMDELRNQNLQDASISFMNLYFSLVSEADATAFAITGLYEMFCDPYGIASLEDVDISNVMWSSPEKASMQAFFDSVLQDTANNGNGVAAQKAFEAYFSADNAPLLEGYVGDVIAFLQSHYQISEGSQSLAACFGRSEARKGYSDAIKSLGGMPSIYPDGEIRERSGYLASMTVPIYNMVRHVSPHSLSGMGLRIV